MKLKSKLLIALTVPLFILGLISEGYFPHMQPPGSFLLFIVFMIIAFFWYVADADEIGYSRTFGMNLAIIICSYFAFIYYFYESRGFVKGTKTTALFLALTSIGFPFVVFLGLFFVSLI